MNETADCTREDAFEAFYNGTAPALWGYAFRVSGDAALADDIVQETFLRYINNVRPELPERPRKAFVYKIASRLLVDAFRRHRVLPLEAVDNRTAGTAPVSKRETLPADLKRLFVHLKPRDRALLWLAYAEGYNHDEIAKICGLRAASVKVMLFRLRRSFVARLRDSGYRPEERL